MKKQAALVPQITSLDWWDRLPPDEQRVVDTETKALQASLVQHGFSRLAVGEHLAKLQEVLEPKRCFVAYLRQFNFSVKSAYRYITGWKTAKERLPEPVLRAAMARGLNIWGFSPGQPLGVYTDIIKRLPPPKTENEEKIAAYLDDIKQAARKRKSRALINSATETRDPNVMLQECYRFFDLRFQRLPNNHKTRATWMRSLVGMMMARLGVGNSQSFEPIAIPDGFRAVRGRPKKNSQAAGAA